MNKFEMKKDRFGTLEHGRKVTNFEYVSVFNLTNFDVEFLR